MGVAELLLKRKQELMLKNETEGANFRSSFSNDANVIALPSGVLYKIEIEGVGEKPCQTSKISCHYQGTNIQGDVFDSSYERGKPTELQINKLIKGWQEVMPLLSVGTKAKLVIPPELAYGDEQKSKEIGPSSTLIFEVELLGIL